MVFKWTSDERWGTDEARVTKLVFIGKDLDHAALKAGFAACILTAESRARKAAKASHAEQVREWAQAALPAAFAGEAVSVAEVRCPKPACPLETVITVRLPKPKEFTLPSALDAVDEPAVVALMHGWAALMERARTVQAWAEQALPKAVAGQRVMVDEVETEHVHEAERLETFIHVLASPAWSMKVRKALCDVTERNVTDVMALAALCGAAGVASVC